jgi:hypothetical protein
MNIGARAFVEQSSRNDMRLRLTHALEAADYSLYNGFVTLARFFLNSQT